jgi:hypothetical protein
MSLFSRLFQYYFNNKHNLLLLILVACAIAISLLPQLLLSPLSENAPLIQPEEQQSVKNSFEQQFYNKNLELELNQTKVEYENLKTEVHLLTSQLKTLQDQQLQQQQELEQSRFHPKIPSHDNLEMEQPMSCPSSENNETSNFTSEVNEERHLQIMQQYQELQKNQGYLYDSFQEFKEFTNNQLESVHLMVVERHQQVDEKITQLSSSFDNRRESIDQVMTRINDKMNNLEEVVSHTREMTEQCENRLHGLQERLASFSHDSTITEVRTPPSQQHVVPSLNQQEIEELIRKTVNEKVSTVVQACQSASSTATSPSPSSSQDEQSHSDAISAPDDYALLSSGTEILFEQTSNTYVPSYYQFKSLYNSIIKKSGLEEYLPSSNHIPEIEYSHSWTESLHNFYGVGSVEDVLKPGMRLGHCWPMKVSNHDISSSFVISIVFLFVLGKSRTISY